MQMMRVVCQRREGCAGAGARVGPDWAERPLAVVNGNGAAWKGDGGSPQSSCGKGRS